MKSLSLCFWFVSLCWSHSTSYIETLLSTVVAILRSTVFPFFHYSSFKCCPILMKIGSDHLWTKPHRNDRTDFFSSMFKSDDVSLTRLIWNWFRGCISATPWAIKTKIGMLHWNHDLRVHVKFGNSVTYRSWDLNFFIFADAAVCQNMI